MLLGDIIKDYRNKHNLSLQDFANLIGTSRGYIHMLEKNYNPSTGKPISPSIITLKSIADAMHTQVDSLLKILDDDQEIILDEKKFNEQFKQPTIKIPVVGTVAAGEPILAQENIIDYEELPANDFQDGKYFGLKIKGDSMFPRILENDVVIIRQQTTAETGQIAVILINGDEATVKQIKKMNSGIMLIPFNNKYEPIFFTNEEIEQKPVKIIGIVKRLIGYNFE